MTEAKHTITWDRVAFNLYTEMYNKATAENQAYFIYKGGLHKLWDVKWLLNRFEPRFKDASVNSVTIPYDL